MNLLVSDRTGRSVAVNVETLRKVRVLTGWGLIREFLGYLVQKWGTLSDLLCLISHETKTYRHSKLFG